MGRILFSTTVALVLLGSGSVIHPESWFASDGAGIPGRALPRSSALKEAYALSVNPVDPSILSDALRALTNPKYRSERHILFNSGQELFRRYFLYDGQGKLRYIETLFADGRFTSETYGDDARLMEERQRTGESGPTLLVRYFYDGGRLSRAETSKDGTSISVDRYLYDRTGGLRRVERTTFLGDTHPTETSSTLVVPRMGTTPVQTARFGPGAALSFIPSPAGVGGAEGRVSYETDARGRVLVERVYSEAGTLISETRNTWSGERLSVVLRSQGGIEYRTDFGYDAAGKRISERNYRAGILERTVVIDGEEEVEDLYAGGRPVLRAKWVGDRKISEERLGRDGGILR